MDARTYEQRRDELVRLIDKALALGAIPAKTGAALSAVRRKVYENQFRIVLVSGFECGKSTTFNLLCGGQEISPRGLMIPTSATIISAQNTMDDALVGKAYVVWRTDRELTLVFAKHLLRYFRELEPDRFMKVNQADQLCDLITYPNDIPLLKRVVAKMSRDIKAAGDADEAERNSLLMAHLIAEHYESEWLAAQKHRNDFTVENLARMICFPDNYQRSWMGISPSVFSAEESAFVFIRQVHCNIRSENLKRTGSIVIDCPGLFASTYDTSVALDVIENADAVWYILNGHGLAESDIDSIKQIVAAKPNGVFFTVNLVNNTERNVREHILEDYSQRIEAATRRKIGIEEFSVYHALLGLTALEAEKMRDGTLDEHSLSEIRRISHYFGSGTESPMEALNDAAFGALNRTYGMPRREAMQLDLFDADGEDVKKCLEKSGVEEIISKVENEVVAKKARSILLDNGARKAVELISAVESDLKVSEDLAKADEFKMQAEFEDAEARLNKFSEFCESQLDDLRGGSTDRLLALDYWSDVIESSVDEVAEKAARQISTYNFNDLRRELSEQIINDTFADVVKPKAVAWANRIKTGKHKLFDDLVGRHVRKIIRETSRQWELVIQDQPILAGLPSPSPVGGTDVMNADLVGSVVAKAPGISSDVVVGATLGVAVGALLGSFVFPFIGTYLGGTLGALIGAGLGGGIGEENRERQVYEELKKSLLCSISEPERKREGVEKQAKRIEALRMGIIREFQAAFEQPANALAVRHEQALNLFNEQTGRRMKIAEEHRRFRIEKLEPLRMEIAAFEKSVKNALGDKTSSDEMASDGTRVLDDNTIWDA